jgi:hypothetical protein
MEKERQAADGIEYVSENVKGEQVCTQMCMAVCLLCMCVCVCVCVCACVCTETVLLHGVGETRLI